MVSSHEPRLYFFTPWHNENIDPLPNSQKQAMFFLMVKTFKKSGEDGKSGKGAVRDTIRDGSKSGKFVVHDINVLGTTKDGVRILKPKNSATHFTEREVRHAVASARAAKKV